MPIELTYEQAKSDLLEIASQNPDYVYVESSSEGCVYFDDTTKQPSCIVGHVLAKYGLKREDMIGELNGVRRDFNYSISPVSLAKTDINIIEADRRTVDLLMFAQSYQDHKTPWGKAVEGAIEMTESNKEKYFGN